MLFFFLPIWDLEKQDCFQDCAFNLHRRTQKKWGWFSIFQPPVIFPTQENIHWRKGTSMDFEKKNNWKFSYQREVIFPNLFILLNYPVEILWGFDFFFSSLVLIYTLAGILNLEYLFLKRDSSYLQSWSTALFTVKKAEQRSMEAQLMTFYSPVFHSAHSLRKSKLWCFSLRNVFWLSFRLVFKGG